MCLKAPFSQEEKLMTVIDSGFTILGKSIQDVEAIALGIGPGSFTGIRIGLATAKGLAWSLGIKMAGLSSLEILARSLPEGLLDKDTLVVPLIDARMNKVFTALFKENSRETEDLDIVPSEWAGILDRRKEKKIVFIGDGYNRHAGAFGGIKDKEIIYLKDTVISGLAICRLAEEKILGNKDFLENPKEILPVYLRKSEAEAQLDNTNI